MHCEGEKKKEMRRERRPLACVFGNAASGRVKYRSYSGLAGL